MLRFMFEKILFVAMSYLNIGNVIQYKAIDTLSLKIKTFSAFCLSERTTNGPLHDGICLQFKRLQWFKAIIWLLSTADMETFCSAYCIVLFSDQRKTKHVFMRNKSKRVDNKPVTNDCRRFKLTFYDMCLLEIPQYAIRVLVCSNVCFITGL